jgi:hypothetical protein
VGCPFSFSITLGWQENLMRMKRTNITTDHQL